MVLKQSSTYGLIAFVCRGIPFMKPFFTVSLVEGPRVRSRLDLKWFQEV